jgi:hypothetical protein
VQKQLRPRAADRARNFKTRPTLPTQIALQKIQRGNSARALAADVKDETARQQWVDYYLQIGDEAQARDLGWRPEGEAAAVTMADEPPGAPPAAAPAADAAGGDGGKEAAAAAAIQAAMRGKVVRAEFQDFKDETARQQWMAYYLELGEYDAAKEYGWEPPPGWTPPAAGEAPAAASSEGAAAPVVPPLKFGEAEAGQLAITNEGGELAESEIPIFSARWFGQVFAAFTPRGETEEEEAKRKEEKAAILVQAFARTLLARIAVKDESRKCAAAPPLAALPHAALFHHPPPPAPPPPVGPGARPHRPHRPQPPHPSPLRYRLLALYAHIEEKHATKIQTQFRESRRLKDEAMAELNKQASTREAPATSVVVAPPPKLTAPPRVKEQTEIDSKVAEVSQASAAVATSFTTSCSPPSPATTTSMPPPPSPPPHLTSSTSTSTSTSRRCTRPQ